VLEPLLSEGHFRLGFSESTSVLTVHHENPVLSVAVLLLNMVIPSHLRVGFALLLFQSAFYTLKEELLHHVAIQQASVCSRFPLNFFFF
jgi:hypothetical protein